MGIARYCTLCRNHDCRMFCRCVVHNHYHATEHYHARENGNYPCGVLNSIDPLQSVEEVLAWEDDFTEEEIENSRLHLETERNNHATVFLLGTQVKKHKQSLMSMNMYMMMKINLIRVYMYNHFSCL